MVPLRRLVALIVIARVRFNVQLVMAVLLCVAGLALVFCGFWVAPSGEIDNSVFCDPAADHCVVGHDKYRYQEGENT